MAQVVRVPLRRVKHHSQVQAPFYLLLSISVIYLVLIWVWVHCLISFLHHRSILYGGGQSKINKASYLF